MDKLREESRRQFEEWWEKFYETSPREPWGVIYSPEHDYYCDQDVDGQYDAWKASRASIVVELPHLAVDKDKRLTVETSREGAFNLALIRCKSAIRSIGLSIKEE
ncbi:hypothetical protein ACUNHY_14175 [Serratia sp. IR-2025]